MTVGPWTQAAKSLVNVAFGDPEMQRANARNEREERLVGAKIDQANASANAARLKAKLDQQELNAANRFALDYANLFKPVEERAFALPQGVQGPQGPVTARPAGLEEFQERLPAFLQTSVQAGAPIQSIGQLLQGIEGQFQTQGVTDFDERQRAIAFGAGKPFSTDQLDAQNRSNLPQGIQDAIASAVPTDQVFGGALASQLDPAQLVGEYRTQNLPNAVRTARAVQADPSLGETIRANSLGSGTTVNVGTGADGTPNTPLTKTMQTRAQQAVVQNEQAARIANDMLEKISSETVGVVPSILGSEAVGIADQIVPGAVTTAADLLSGGSINRDNTVVGRETLRQDIQSLRSALVNEDGKLSDKDQALVERLGAALQPGLKPEQARAIIETAITRWQSEGDANRDILREGLDISDQNGGEGEPLVQTQEEFDALPSGTAYTEEPGGPVFVKP